MFKIARTIFLSISLTVLGGPLAAWADEVPNQYELHGGNLHIVYSTSGFDGQPHLVYQAGLTKLNFAGDQIRSVETEIGALVTASTRISVDAGSSTFSLLLPRVNLGSNLSARINALGIISVHRFSPIPQFNLGQVDKYTQRPLTGTAKFVLF